MVRWRRMYGYLRYPGQWGEKVHLPIKEFLLHFYDYQLQIWYAMSLWRGEDPVFFMHSSCIIFNKCTEVQKVNCDLQVIWWDSHFEFQDHWFQDKSSNQSINQSVSQTGRQTDRSLIDWSIGWWANNTKWQELQHCLTLTWSWQDIVGYSQSIAIGNHYPSFLQ